jgi:hypothetical protein
MVECRLTGDGSDARDNGNLVGVELLRSTWGEYSCRSI